MGNVHMEATQINYRGGSKKMSVEEAIKAAGTEITPEEKTWIDSIPTLASGKADNDVIAPEFDSEEGVYAIGDLVMHEGKLYEFTTAHETAGDWDSTEVTEKTVADELDSVKSGLINDIAITPYESQPPQPNPFDEGGSGYVGVIKYHGTILGYLSIRPKNFVSGTKPVAMELYDASWHLVWQVLRDAT